MANQSWAQPSGQPPEWAVEDGADATSSHSDPAQPAAPQRHAIGDALAAIEHSLDEVGTAQWQDVPESELRELTRRVARVSARLSAHQMAAARCMEKAGTARRAGATSTGQMMAGDFGGDRRGAEDLVRTAGTLDEAGASATQEALAAGDISPEQAKIIGRTVNALPKHLTERERLEVETKLLDAAGRLSLTDLRRRSKRALEDVRPDPEPDEDEDRETRRQEKSAWEKTCFSMWDRKDGTHGFNGIVPDLQAHQLRALLDAVVSPRRKHLVDEPGSGASDTDERRDESDEDDAHRQDAAPPPTTPEEMTPYPNQLGQALCGLIEHFPTDGFAQAGGSPVSLAISFAFEHLANASAEVAGTLTDGLRVSAGQIRRLACTQQLIPQVFNGRSVPLDQGTAKRLFTKDQRRVLAQRDLGCAFPSCDRPPQWCDGHHVRSWSKGGRTDLGNGVLLCFFHHHAVHDQGWSVRLHPGDGLPEFAHPEHTGGVWRRNHRFRASSDLVPHLGAVP